ncbi:apolipoprotein N-acyltransferase [Amycolatopsis marina]|uniref:Apolipoprotein N-acyltransferase n=1 Tax=Amycolatopsis marina TaxID=490629 RepID=A0A1I1BYQ6_9PSEU|nr:apolipoprotein N-acyltransferase [Amycolatopsis marina]SFB54826.1 apolipoprotein N-acyltransferase [Amycolatopsis marina]
MTDTVASPGAATRRWRPVAARLLLTALSGFVLYLSFPPRPLWWLAPLAFAGLGLVLFRRRFWAGAGYGLVFGLVFFLAHLVWIQDFLGADFGSAPWLGLSAVMALFVAAACGLMTQVTTLPAAPVWMAMVFLLQETVRSRWPINGFPWGRVAFGQPEGAYLSLASVGGAPLVGFAVLLTGFGLARLGVLLHAGHRRPDPRWITPVACTLLPVIAGLALWPTVGTTAEAGTRSVAVVQGNAPDAGLGLLGQRATIRRNHLEASAQLARRIESGAVPRPDLVVWPETATEVRGPDPVLNEVVDAFGAPTLIGALYRLPTGQAQNTVIEWQPGTGQVDRYAKQELVPFAEYVPLRSIARLFTPFVDDTGDMLSGTEPGVFDVAGTKVGLAICYEAAYDYVSREATRAGAELLVIPTNNAWYGPGEMSYQQLAMSRVRAVEHGRAVVVAATSGVSAIVRPDGSLDASTSLFTQETLLRDVPLRQQTTLSDRLGAWTEYVLVGAALLAVASGVVLTRRTRRANAEKTDESAARGVAEEG